MLERYRNITWTGEGFSGEVESRLSDAFFHFSASPRLFFTRMAWEAGLDLEEEADGFGKGMGTHGDWSAIRDSSDPAIDRMFTKAVNFIAERLEKPAKTAQKR